MISVFDMFKVGIGPSSSHTVGPMKAAKQFVDELISRNLLTKINRLQAHIYGSLSLTGRGHNTDIAVIMGLMGYLPDNVDIESIEPTITNLKQTHHLTIAQADLANAKEIKFDFYNDMPFHYDFLPRHENGMILKAFENDELLFEKTYYSIGGGFIVDDEHFGEESQETVSVPYPCLLYTSPSPRD